MCNKASWVQIENETRNVRTGRPLIRQTRLTKGVFMPEFWGINLGIPNS